MRHWLLAALVLSGAPSVGAHHSISGAYDSNRPVTVEAIVTRFRFVNPHPYLEAQVTDAQGLARAWHMELDNRGELASIGVSDDTFKPGDRIIVNGSASRTQANAMYVRK